MPAKSSRLKERTGRTILVTGGTGHQGSAVARSLLENGWKVRALVRDDAKIAARVLARKGVELVKGDLDDRPSIERALKGVYGVFAALTWAGHGAEGEVREGKALADAAKAGGVKHFVYSSAAGAEQNTGVSYFESKRTIEEYLKGIGLPVTVFRPVFFMFNFAAPEVTTSILKGTLAMPLRPDRPLQMLAVEDLAVFVRLAFDDPEEYRGKSIKVAGDELTMQQVADTFSRILGRAVHYAEQPLDAVRRFNADRARMFDWMNREGEGSRVDLAELCEVHPGLMSLETWLRKSKWARAA